MKTIISTIVIIVFLLASCTSSKKYLEQGQYDSAVRLAVKKLMKNPNKEKDILVLEKAYPLAIQKDNDRISFLKKEGKPDSWDEIFGLYSNLKNRQSLVKEVLPLKLEGRTIDFKFIDYDQEVIQSKQRAAEYYYVHAKKLMENSSDKLASRDAYYELMQVKSYYSNYQDVDKLLPVAKNNGMSQVLVNYQNKSRFSLSKEFEEELFSFGVQSFNSEWVDYTMNSNKNDFIVLVKLKIIDVSPEKIKEDRQIETKKVPDGFEYKLDSKGNVMKDSLGNDIKTPKFKNISCKFIRSIQSKAAHIEGSVDYINAYNNQIIKSIPIAADNFFENIAAMAIGDIEALSPENRKIVGKPPVPFPSDISMIYEAGKTLKSVLYNAMHDNKKLIK